MLRSLSLHENYIPLFNYVWPFFISYSTYADKKNMLFILVVNINKNVYQRETIEMSKSKNRKSESFSLKIAGILHQLTFIWAPEKAAPILTQKRNLQQNKHRKKEQMHEKCEIRSFGFLKIHCLRSSALRVPPAETRLTAYRRL